MNPIVDTFYGQVKGRKISSELGFDYFGFTGIPFMKQPLGKLRFQEAQAPEKWTDVFDATKDIPSYCMTSFMTSEQEGQENGAVINVFTKNINSDKKLPVMIWIHGGAFSRGSSRDDIYNPEYLLMSNDIIFVSFNYRLGPIGFLSLNDPSLNVPGNNGLKDQIFALEWVQKNIENFGGDSKNVTIFGESAGGASCHYMCITPRTRGLFHRAIIISGTALNVKTWTVPDRRAESLARKLGWNGAAGDERSILEFLENVSAFDLDSAAYKIVSAEEKMSLGSIMAFGPVVEPYVTEKCVVSRDVVQMTREAWSNEIDVIIVGSSFEGLLFANLDKGKAAEFHRNNPEFYLPLLELNLKPKTEISKRLGKKIGDLYNISSDLNENYYNFCSDFHFWNGIYRVLTSRNAQEKGKTFLLRFDVDGELNLFKKFVKNCSEYKGTCHADDLFYMFKSSYYPMPSSDSKEFAVIKKLTTIVTSFAVNGNPAIAMKPVDNMESLKCTNMTLDGIEEIELPELKNLKVWDSVYRECDKEIIRSKI